MTYNVYGGTLNLTHHLHLSDAVNMMFCVVSVNASRLTTLIIAGCDNVSDMFLLTSFLSDVPAEVNWSSSTPVSSVCEAPVTAVTAAAAAAGSWQTENSRNAVSQRSSSHTLNHSEVLAPFRRNCAAGTCNKELCSSVAPACARKWNVDRGSDGTVQSVIASNITVNPGTASGWQSTVNGARKNHLAAVCTRMTHDEHSCTNKTYRLEHLDISGCWRITDLSVRSVYCLFI